MKLCSVGQPSIPALASPTPAHVYCTQLDIPIGTMMELPRACVTADEIVGTDGVEFMSFGTNVRSRWIEVVSESRVTAESLFLPPLTDSTSGMADRSDKGLGFVRVGWVCRRYFFLEDVPSLCSPCVCLSLSLSALLRDGEASQ